MLVFIRADPVQKWTTRAEQSFLKVKVKVSALAIAPLTRVRLVTTSALQYRKWQPISMSQWCRSVLCGHPLPALTDNWTHGAASRHTIAPIRRGRGRAVMVEYRTRNREVAGSTHTRSTANNLEQVANLLCAQANSASYPQRDGK